MKKKGQVFSMDFISSIVPFLFILTLILLIWFNINYKIDQRENNLEIQNKITSLSEILIKTEGNPSNWEDPTIQENEIKSLGLASNDNVVDSGKFFRLVELDYIPVRKKLGIPRFQLFLGLYDKDNQIIELDGIEMVYGVYPPESEEKYSVTRFVALEHNEERELASLKVILW